MSAEPPTDAAAGPRPPAFMVVSGDGLALRTQGPTLLHAGVTPVGDALDLLALLDCPRLRRVRLRMAGPGRGPMVVDPAAARGATLGGLLTLARWPRQDVGDLVAEVSGRVEQLVRRVGHPALSSITPARRRILQSVLQLGRGGSLGALALAPLMLDTMLLASGQELRAAPGAPVLVSHGSVLLRGPVVSDLSGALAEAQVQVVVDVRTADGGAAGPGPDEPVEGPWRRLTVDGGVPVAGPRRLGRSRAR